MILPFRFVEATIIARDSNEFQRRADQIFREIE